MQYSQPPRKEIVTSFSNKTKRVMWTLLTIFRYYRYLKIESNGIIIVNIPFHVQAFALRTFISQYGITEPLFEKCSSDGKSVPYFDSARAKVNRASLHFISSYLKSEYGCQNKTIDRDQNGVKNVCDHLSYICLISDRLLRDSEPGPLPS